MVYALDGRGGGQALPPYLQGRSRTMMGESPFQSRPMITPKSTVAPGETKPQLPGAYAALASRVKAKPAGLKPVVPAAPTLTPPAAATPTAPAKAAPAQTLYEFFKRDLENQRDAALADARTDAAARGVYYGTPLTTSQGDIQTEYQRGLGQLSAGILQNEQQNELQRLGLASSLLSGTPMAQGGGIDPSVFQTIGALFAPRQGPTNAPNLTPPPQQPPLTKDKLRI